MPRTASSARFPVVPGSPPPRLQAPRELSTTERRVFNDLISSTKPSHFHASDLPLIATFCRAVAIERSAAAALKAGKDKTALSRWSQATKVIVALSLRLRISPQARQPNLPTRPTPVSRAAQSYYDTIAPEEGDE
jgi:hypothetical protein